MAIARRGTVKTADSTSATSLSVTIDATVAAGDLMLLWTIGQGALTIPTGWFAIRTYQDNGNVRSAMLAKIATSTDHGTTLTVTQATAASLQLVQVSYGGAQVKSDVYTQNWGNAPSPFVSTAILPLTASEVLLSVMGMNQATTGPTGSNAGTQLATNLDAATWNTLIWEFTGGGTPAPQFVWTGAASRFGHIDAVTLTPTGGNGVVYSPATVAGTKQNRPGRVLKGRQSAALDDAAVA